MNKTMKKLFGFVMAAALAVTPVLQTASFAVSGNADKAELNYVSLGDSMTNGYGLPGYEFDHINGESDPDIIFQVNVNGFMQGSWGLDHSSMNDSYPAQFSSYLREQGYDVNWSPLAISAMRAEDLHFILEFDYTDAELLDIAEMPVWNEAAWNAAFSTGDYYTWDEFTDNRFHDYSDVVEEFIKAYGSSIDTKKYEALTGTNNVAKVYQDAIKEADIISLAVGNANFGVFLLGRVMNALNFLGSTPDAGEEYKLDNAIRELDPAVQELIKDLTEDLKAELYAVAGEYMDLTVMEGGRLDSIVDILVYGAISYAVNYAGVLDRIYELNDNKDLELIIVGLLNTMTGMQIDVDGSVFNFGGYLGYAIKLVNGYLKGLATAYEVKETLINHPVPNIYYASANLTNEDLIFNVMAKAIDENGNWVGNDTVRSRIIESVDSTIFPMLGYKGKDDPAVISLADVKAYENKTPVEKISWATTNADKAYAINLYLAFESAVVTASSNTILDLDTFTSLAAGLNGDVFAGIFETYEDAVAEATKNSVAIDSTDAYYLVCKEVIANTFNDMVPEAYRSYVYAEAGVASFEGFLNVIVTNSEEDNDALNSRLKALNPGFDGAVDKIYNRYTAAYQLLAVPSVLGATLSADPMVSGLLTLFARMMVGNGIGCHPNEKGHDKLFAAVKNAYVNQNTATESFTQNVTLALGALAYWLGLNGVEYVDEIINSEEYQNLLVELAALEAKAIATYNKAEAELNAALAKLETELGLAEAELEAVLADLELIVKGEYDAFVAAQTAKIEALKADLEAKIEVLKAYIAEVEAQLLVLNNEIEVLVSAVENLNAALADAIATGNADNIEEKVNAIFDTIDPIVEAVNNAAIAAKETAELLAPAAIAVAVAAEKLYTTVVTVIEAVKEIYAVMPSADEIVAEIERVQAAANALVAKATNAINAAAAELKTAIVDELNANFPGLLDALELAGKYLGKAADIILGKIDALQAYIGTANNWLYVEILALIQCAEDNIANADEEAAAELAELMAEIKVEYANALDLINQIIDAQANGSVELVNELNAKLQAVLECLKAKIICADTLINNIVADINNAVADVKAEIEAQIEALKNKLEEIDNAIAAELEKLGDCAAEKYEEIKAEIADKIADLEALKAEILEQIAELEKALEELIATAEATIAELNAVVEQFIADVTALIEEIIAKAETAIQVGKDILENLAADVTEAVKQAIADGKLALEEALNVIESAVMSVIESIKLDEEEIRYVIEALYEDLLAAAEDLANNVKAILDDILAAYEEAMNEIFVLSPATKYVSIGDAGVTDIGLPALQQGKGNDFPGKLAAALMMDYTNLGFDGFRIEEVRYILDENYVPDAYYNEVILNTVGDVTELRSEFIAEIESADFITVGFNNNSFTSFVASQLMNPVELDWSRYVGAEGVAYVEALLAELNAYLVESVGETYAAYLALAIESYAYSYIGFSVNYTEVINKIHAINPDAFVAIVGMYNPIDDLVITAGETEVNIGDFIDAIVGLSNFQYNVYALLTENTVFVEIPDVETAFDALNAGKEVSIETYVMTMINNMASFYPNEIGHEYIKDQILGLVQIDLSQLGDIDLDGDIDMDDVIKLLRHVAKAEIITDPASLAVSDIIADGDINMDDVIKLLRFVAKAIPNLN